MTGAMVPAAGATASNQDPVLWGPDGKPLSLEGAMIAPHALNFANIIRLPGRVYPYGWDEALREAPENALAMRRDAFYRSLMQERTSKTINLEWQVACENDADPMEVLERDTMARCWRQTPDRIGLVTWLLEAIWFGRSAQQLIWGDMAGPGVTDLASGTTRPMKGVTFHEPVHGDSVQFSWDNTPIILTSMYTAQKYRELDPDAVVSATDRGAYGLRLYKPEYRSRFVIHKHVREASDYYEGEMSGGVHGVGLRSWSYWSGFMKRECLSWMTSYMQSAGMMDLLIFNYPDGNAQAKTKAEENAKKIVGKIVLLAPYNPAVERKPAIEQIPMNAAGFVALQGFIENYWDRHIERMFVGQSMSAGGGASGGLEGSGRAEFAADTKGEIQRTDAGRLAETLSTDWLKVAHQFNFPGSRVRLWMEPVLDDAKGKEKVEAFKTLNDADVEVEEQELRKAAGYREPRPGKKVTKKPQEAPPAMPPGKPDANAPRPKFGPQNRARLGKPSGASLYAFDESKHHRGQPENAGEFGPGGSGGEDKEGESGQHDDDQDSDDEEPEENAHAEVHGKWSEETDEDNDRRADEEADLEGRHDKEFEAHQGKYDAETERVEAKRGKEDDKLTEKREKEDAKTEAKRDKLREKREELEGDWADADADRASDRKDYVGIIARSRAKEDEAAKKARAAADKTRERAYTLEKKVLESRHAAEEEKADRAFQASEQTQEDADAYNAVTDRHTAEEAELETRHDKIQIDADAEASAAEAATEAAREKEDADVAAEEAEEDAKIEAHREAEDAAWEKIKDQWDAEDNATQEARDAEDETLQAEREAEDAEREEGHAAATEALEGTHAGEKSALAAKHEEEDHQFFERTRSEDPAAHEAFYDPTWRAEFDPKHEAWLRGKKPTTGDLPDDPGYSQFMLAALYADAAGHEHAPAGSPDGGQFTGKTRTAGGKEAHWVKGKRVDDEAGMAEAHAATGKGFGRLEHGPDARVWRFAHQQKTSMENSLNGLKAGKLSGVEAYDRITTATGAAHTAVVNQFLRRFAVLRADAAHRFGEAALNSREFDAVEKHVAATTEELHDGVEWMRDQAVKSIKAFNAGDEKMWRAYKAEIAEGSSALEKLGREFMDKLGPLFAAFKAKHPEQPSTYAMPDDVATYFA